MSDKFYLLLTLEKQVTPDASEYLEQIELGEFDSEAEARAALEEILETAEIEVEE